MIGTPLPLAQTPVRSRPGRRQPSRRVAVPRAHARPAGARLPGRRSSPDFSLRTTRSPSTAIWRSRLRRVSISWTPPAGFTCARSCTASCRGRARCDTYDGGPEPPRIPFASSFEAPRTGCRPLHLGSAVCLEPTARRRLFLLGQRRLRPGSVLAAPLHGGQISLFAGLLGAASLAWRRHARSAGVAGFYGGWVDEIIMRAAELFLALPWLYLLFAVRMALPLHIAPAQAFLLILLGHRARRVGAPGAIDPRRRAERRARDYVRGGTERSARRMSYLLRRHVLPQVVRDCADAGGPAGAAIHPGRGHAVVLRSRRGRTGAKLGEHAGQPPTLSRAVVVLVDVPALDWRLIPVFLLYYALADALHQRLQRSRCDA